MSKVSSPNRSRPCFHVVLDHVDAALRAFQDLVVGDLDAVAGAVLAAFQVAQHGAVAAADVQHVRAVAGPSA
jgi:homoserine acetyltransferase